MFSLKPNSIKARVVKNDKPNSNLITFELFDTSVSEPFISRITFENNAKEQNRGALCEEDIYTIIENIEEYKELASVNNSTKILKRLDGLNISLLD